MKKMPFLMLFLFIGLALGSCKKDEDGSDSDDTDNPEVNVKPVPSAGKYVLFKAGSEYQLMERGGNTGNGAGSFGSGNQFEFWEANFLQFNKLTNKPPQFTLVFYKYFPKFSTHVDAADIDGMYVVGEYPFSDADDDEPTDGIAIEWFDTDGVFWSTYNGSGDQTGSKFNLMSRTPSAGATASFTSSGTFKCTLYDQNGNSMKVTEGEYTSLTGYFF